VGETPTLLESSAGFAVAAVEHGVDGAGVLFLGGEGFGGSGGGGGGLGGHDAALFLFDVDGGHQFASFRFEVFREEKERKVMSKWSRGRRGEN
jgi:hypothetical protein